MQDVLAQLDAERAALAGMILSARRRRGGRGGRDPGRFQAGRAGVEAHRGQRDRLWAGVGRDLHGAGPVGEPATAGQSDQAGQTDDGDNRRGQAYTG